jgi:hypothetical protein
MLNLFAGVNLTLKLYEKCRTFIFYEDKDLVFDALNSNLQF